MQQASAIEGGGFRGRTNKLVDGCYGWWVGGLFAVLESLVRGEDDSEEKMDSSADGEWEDEKERGKCKRLLACYIGIHPGIWPCRHAFQQNRSSRVYPYRCSKHERWSVR
jgi:hypothetical protein